MQDLDYLLDENGDVDVELCQAIADEAAFQAWRDLPIDNPELYAQICAERESRYKSTSTTKADNKAKDKDLKPIFIAHW